MSGGLPLRAHVPVAADLNVADLSQPAFLDDRVAGLDQMRGAAPLGADLDHALVLSRGGQHRCPSATSTLIGFWQ